MCESHASLVLIAMWRVATQWSKELWKYVISSKLSNDRLGCFSQMPKHQMTPTILGQQKLQPAPFTFICCILVYEFPNLGKLYLTYFTWKFPLQKLLEIFLRGNSEVSLLHWRSLNEVAVATWFHHLASWAQLVSWRNMEVSSFEMGWFLAWMYLMDLEINSKWMIIHFSLGL